MEPISAGIAIVGLGMSIFGGMSGANEAQHQAELGRQASGINQLIAGDEQQINDQRRQQMELDSRRQQMEIFRNAQRARATGTAAAINQGAAQGSGLQGGLGQIQGQEGTNLLGIGQNLQIGENIFGFNNDISGKKRQLAGIQGQMGTSQGNQASDAAWASLGGSLMKAGPTIGGLGRDAFAGMQSMNLGQGMFGGGSPSGYGRA